MTPTYRTEAPIARYRLRTNWRDFFVRMAREAAIAGALALVVRWLVWVWLVVRHDSSFPPWLDGALALLPIAPVAFALLGLRRWTVHRDAAIELYADRLELFVGGHGARVFPLASLRIDVTTAEPSPSLEAAALAGLPVEHEPLAIRLEGDGRHMELPAVWFETPWHAGALARAIRRLRGEPAADEHDEAHDEHDALDERLDDEIARSPDRIPR